MTNTKIVAQNRDRRSRVKQHLGNIGIKDEAGILGTLGGDYPSIDSGRLPKGIELQDQVEIIVEDAPSTNPVA